MSHFCMSCGFTQEEAGPFIHDCPNPIHIVFMNKTRWGRFVDWFFDLDVVYILSFIAASTVNGLLVQYTPLGPWERLIEAVCVGVMMPRLFKKC